MHIQLAFLLALENFGTTLIAGTIILGLAFIGMMIGLIITGKNKFKKGSCGRFSSSSNRENCKNKESCSLCSHTNTDLLDPNKKE